MSEDDRTVWVGNLDTERTTQDVLYELFLQAGPLHYVKIPKDRESGKQKSFGFICYLHQVSVPYAIELLNGIPLFDRNLRVQSRNHQQRQREGLVTGDIGVHTLDPNAYNSNPNVASPMQGCAQQSLMGVAPNLLGSPGAMINHHAITMARQHQQYKQQQSLMGVMPNLLNAAQGQINPQLIAMAQQQMALLSAHQPVLLSHNPMLNAHHQHTSDRFGSVNHRRHDSAHRNTGRYDNNRGSDRGRYDSNRGEDRRPRSLDNNAMQNFKANFDNNADYNSQRLAELQQRQGRFDFNRLGPPVGSQGGGSRHNDNRNDDRYNRSDSHSQYRHSSSRHDPYSRNGSRH